MAAAAPAVLQGRRWLWAEVWGGRELQVLVHLGALQLDTCLPLYQSKPGALLEPAFPGYAFVHAELGEWAWREIHSLHGVIRLLQHDAERPMVVPEVAKARVVLAYGVGGLLTDAASRPECATLRHDALVEVLDGPFAGHTASVVEDKGDRMRVSVLVFGRATECDLPRLAIGPT